MLYLLFVMWCASNDATFIAAHFASCCVLCEKDNRCVMAMYSLFLLF